MTLFEERLTDRRCFIKVSICCQIGPEQAAHRHGAGATAHRDHGSLRGVGTGAAVPRAVTGRLLGRI